jgi:uncharacterized Zn finger protein
MAKRRRNYNYYFDFEPTRPIETDEGIKAHSKRGAFAKNWWATRWIEAMERLVDSGRLSRGRRYARKGQVLSIEEKKDGVQARVQGSRRTPYKVTIQVMPLKDTQWEKVIDVLADQALFTAQLLAGEMPNDIDQVFEAAGTSLFPARSGDLITECSCPDWSNPCKHVAATHYILGERFDEDPFLLFRLRGRSQEQILQGLRQRRAGQESDEEEDEIEVIVPLEETLERFWDVGEALDAFPVSIRHPAIEMPLLKRLGEPPYAPAPGLQALLRPAYQAFSQTAVDKAFGDAQNSDDI